MKRRPAAEPSPYESGTWGTPEQPCPSERTLAARLDGELSEVADAVVDTHLDGCATCSLAYRRLEGLSGLLRGWEVRHARVEAPPRLATRVLRAIAPEGLALRRETLRETRRAFLTAAAAACVLVGAFLAGRAASTPPFRSADASPDSSALAAGRGSASEVASPTLEAPVPQFAPFTVAALERALLDAGLGHPVSPLPEVFDDPAAASALGLYAHHLAAQDRCGELACVMKGRTIPMTAVAAFEQMNRRYDWLAERAQRATFPPTRDPSAQGTALADRLPGLDATYMSRVLARARASVPASRGEGGLLLWGLPSVAGDEAAMATPDDTIVLDLASAAEREWVRFRPDTFRPGTTSDRLSVTLEIAPCDASILIPSGELLTGGAGDRVVLAGTWIRASGEPQVVVLPCRPLSRHAQISGGTPRAFGAVAGPGLRAALRGEADAEAILAIVDGQLADAGFPARESLLALYRDDGGRDPVALRARTLLDALGDAVPGFLAADPSGRFQGMEATDLAPPAARRFLERLLAGYLLEARSRSSLDGGRPGAHVELVLGVLSSGTLRLEDVRVAGGRGPGLSSSRGSAQSSSGTTSSSGSASGSASSPGAASGLLPASSPGGVERLDEPRTGVRLEALTRPGSRRATHFSGSIPEVR